MQQQALIIGATGGIGSAVARRLAANGWELMLAAQDETRLAALAEELGARHATVDARDFDAVDALVGQALDELGGLCGLVCAVGSILLKPAHLTSADELHETLSINVDPAFALVRAMGKRLRKHPSSVVLFSSAAARAGMPNHEAIGAAKGAVEGLVRAAAASYAGRGHRINAIAPGLVDTPLAEPITSREASLKASEAMHPLGRIGQADEVGSLACWLLSPEAAWTTGQVFSVDGGLSTVRGRG